MSPAEAQTQVYGTSPVKRQRRTQSAIHHLKSALFLIVAGEHPATCRQVFYQAATAKLVEKTEPAYKMVCRHLADMRLVGSLPFGWIADSTRWMRKPDSFSGLEDAIESTARFYRRDVLREQPVYLEVWCEKDALAGVIYDVTSVYDIPLMVCKGYASLTYLYAAAEAIAAQRKPAHLFYFGDFDPSGVDISRNVERRLREFAPGAEIHFERVAVNEEQIDEWNLPTRPTKTKDTRSGNFGARSVELDAIPPKQLRELVRAKIEQYISPRQLEVLKVAEDSERTILMRMAKGFSPGGGDE